MASPTPRRSGLRWRPAKYGYNFAYLKDFPRRLLSPPKSPASSVGHVRSFKVTPMYDVSLNDVLDGRHLPPLTLKDFEDYLVFEEHSAENLYFICWLRDYTKQYNEWEQSHSPMPSEKRETNNPDLTISFARARGTFFDPSSHLELNLPGELTENLLRETKTLPYASPEQFAEVQKHVEGMLHESLMKFVVGSCKNSGRRRGFFALLVGAAAFLVGLAPVLMSILRGESRWVRLAALFPFWFGAMTAIAGLHGVCVVIFLFGDARQLYPYELARPYLSPVPPVGPLQLPFPVTAKQGSPRASRTSLDIAGAGNGSSPYDTEKITMSPSVSTHPLAHDGSGLSSQPATTLNHATSTQTFDYIPETAGFIPSYEPSISSTTRAQSDANHSQTSSSPWKFDFDTLPPPSPRKSQDTMRKSLEEINPIFRDRGMFATLTKVFSPMSRAQWEIVMRSAMLGALVALLVGAVCFAVPPKH